MSSYATKISYNVEDIEPHKLLHETYGYEYATYVCDTANFVPMNWTDPDCVYLWNYLSMFGPDFKKGRATYPQRNKVNYRIQKLFKKRYARVTMLGPDLDIILSHEPKPILNISRNLPRIQFPSFTVPQPPGKRRQHTGVYSL